LPVISIWPPFWVGGQKLYHDRLKPCAEDFFGEFEPGCFQMQIEKLALIGRPKLANSFSCIVTPVFPKLQVSVTPINYSETFFEDKIA
jgi:hypothetical protein